MKNPAALELLIKEALRLQALQTPEERAAAKREAAIDFAYGNLTFTGRRPYITRELIEREYDRMHEEKVNS
jgi:hypothetical protein